MNGGTQPDKQAPGQPKRRPWLTLKPQQPSLEEACRSAHAFASKFPGLYRWRVSLLSLAVCIAPFCALTFMCLAASAFPWAFRESEFLRPLFVEPVLRWAIICVVFAAIVPRAAIYAAGLIRGLALRLPEVEGHRLGEADAPRLFRALGEISRSLDAPAIEEVRVSAERTLEILHEPSGRLAVFGRARTILMMGLPLAEEVSPQQFRALVAHEIAHLATHKRRFGGRVLAVRRRLAVIRRAAEANALRGGYWSRLPDESLLETIDGMIRRLTADTFPAIRQHEAEADAIAATIAGREFAVSALLRQRIAGHALTQQFQAECLNLAETLPEPPADLFDRRAVASGGELSEGQINAWVRAELELKDNLAAPHPPMWDRLRLMGFKLGNLPDLREIMVETQPARELGETAARFFLGDAAETLRGEFFKEWASHQAPAWKNRFLVYEGLRTKAAEWENGNPGSVSDPAAMWQIAVAVGNTRGWREALPLAQRILEASPDHPDANLLAGQFMIEDGNREGLQALERAMKSDPRLTTAACTLAARFLEGKGEREPAAEYNKRCEERKKEEQEIARQRKHVHATDALSPADCPAEHVELLLGVLKRHASLVRAAYLVRKQVPDGDRHPLYVLGVERRFFPFENAARANRLLLERIVKTSGMPPDVLVCVVTRANGALLKSWKRVANSVIYPRAEAVRAEMPTAEIRPQELIHETQTIALQARNPHAAVK